MVLLVIKNTQYWKLCEYLSLSAYIILSDIWAYHLQMKCMDRNCFLGHPYTESTITLYDTILPVLLLFGSLL